MRYGRQQHATLFEPGARVVSGHTDSDPNPKVTRSDTTNGYPINVSPVGEKAPGEVEVLRTAQAAVSSFAQLHCGGARSGELEHLAAATETLLQPEEDNGGKIRVSVYGPDESPSAHNLVTALLDDPLSSDVILRSVIQDRLETIGRENAKEIRRFEYSGSPSSSGSTTPLSSPFLTRFANPIVLEELPPPSSAGASSPLVHLLTSDIPILVCAPFIAHPSTPAREPALRNPNALLILDCALDPASPSAGLITARLAAAYGCSQRNILFVDAGRALRGLSALRVGAGSARAVRQYQEDVLGAQLPVLHRILADSIMQGKQRLRANAAQTVAESVADVGRRVLKEAKEEVSNVREAVSALRSRALEERERVLGEVLSGNRDTAEEAEKGKVAKGIERVEKDVRPTLDRLKWWKLPSAVDDMSVRVDRAVEQAYTKEFVNILVFHTGRISRLQSSLSSHTTTFLSSLPPPFHSPILHNTLAQLTSAPSFPIAPSALLAPLHARTAQLAYATRALHLSAQRLLLASFFSVSFSSLGSYALWLAHTLDMPTAAGGAALATLAGVRWAIGRWERARRAWWADFGRVGAGLERDLRNGLEDVLDKQVCAAPEEACRGLGRIVEKREREIATVEGMVEELEEVLQRSKSHSTNEIETREGKK
ncbi:hypothetical protein M0805_006731 [Coniferiporia weirii]|nr:hypothetical protein M0805_006731 [Coniferiporia weirii]